MKNKESNFGVFFVNLLLVFMVIGGIVGLAVAPADSPLPMYQSEKLQSTRFFGEWPVAAAERWQEEVELSRAEFLETLPQEGDIARVVSDWFVSRSELLCNVLQVLLQRSAVALLCLVAFLPACFISLYCGHLRREEAKQRFSFSSPYRMRTRWTFFKLLVVSFMVLFFFPTAVSMLLFPLLIGGMALYSGWLVSGLQKEI